MMGSLPDVVFITVQTRPTRRRKDTMFQVRIHGRGGQGVVTGAEMLSIAAFLGGKHAQAFPSFGSERTGAPVVAFCRIDDKEIRLREPIMQPDALIIQDPTLLHQVDAGSKRMATSSSTPPAPSISWAWKTSPKASDQSIC